MMNIREIEALPFDEIEWSRYQGIFAASGFEARSTHVPSLVPKDQITKLFVIGFSSDRDTLSRRENDQWFTDATGLEPTIPDSPTHTESIIYGYLNSIVGEDVFIAVDYSTMTRDWYGRILTWAKYQTKYCSVTLDFYYSHGVYRSEFDHLQIKDIVCVPGYEGVGAGARYTTAFFGLGFDGAATSTVGDLIEADKLICFIARGGDIDPHADEVLSKNSQLLSESRTTPISLPLSDVRRSTSILLENINQHCNDSDKVIVIPMGPKPHVLASLIACQIISKAACLHVKGTRKDPVQVDAAGPVTVTRIRYQR